MKDLKLHYVLFYLKKKEEEFSKRNCMHVIWRAAERKHNQNSVFSVFLAVLCFKSCHMLHSVALRLGFKNLSSPAPPQAPTRDPVRPQPCRPRTAAAVGCFQSPPSAAPDYACEPAGGS